MSTTSFGAPGEPEDATAVRVRKAARALPRHDLGHAYGHVSARLDADSFLVCPPKPMGLIEPGEPCTVVPVDGPLPDGVLGEVRMHQQIYKRRPDVGGVIRTFVHSVLTLSTMRRTPKVRHGFGAYFRPQAALWDDPLLVRNDEAAAGVADTLGEGRAVVLRGNGLVACGTSVEEAAVMVFYLDQAARTELSVLACAANPDIEPVEFTPEQAEARDTSSGMIFERMWDYLTDGDPE
ncbi:MAG: class II aldolase/adducin family protein [Alphaproteobacteria bacterium]|nr:class II aldolase/adducin family protein [Alphaproteobacteria bacterium]